MDKIREIRNVLEENGYVKPPNTIVLQEPHLTIAIHEIIGIDKPKVVCNGWPECSQTGCRHKKPHAPTPYCDKDKWCHKKCQLAALIPTPIPDHDCLECAHASKTERGTVSSCEREEVTFNDEGDRLIISGTEYLWENCPFWLAATPEPGDKGLALLSYKQITEVDIAWEQAQQRGEPVIYNNMLCLAQAHQQRDADNLELAHVVERAAKLGAEFAAAVQARTQKTIDAINQYAEGRCSLERLAEDIGVNFYELHAAMRKYENHQWYDRDNS